jgi:hypothetical protein
LKQFVPLFSAQGSAEAKLLKANEGTDSSEIQRKPIIRLITPVAGKRWRIGDPEYGDVRQQPNGALDGLYFVELKNEDTGEAPPLCRMELDPGALEADVSVQIEVRFGDLICQPADVEELRAAGNPAWLDKNSEMVSRQLQIRSRLAGLVLTKHHDNGTKGGLPGKSRRGVTLSRISLGVRKHGELGHNGK